MITPERIIKLTFQTYKQPLGDDRTHKQKPVECRQVAMYLTRKHTKLSYSEIARVFNRTHSTVMHACRKVGGLIDIYSDVKERVSNIEELLMIL